MNKTLRRKIVEEKDYCMLGKENYCPHLESCFSRGRYSMNVKKIENGKKIPENAIGWENVERLEKFACIQRIAEKESLPFLGSTINY